MELQKLTTEAQNERTKKIDRCGTVDILRLINEEDKIVPGAVAKEIPAIARAVDAVVHGLKNGGRLFYIGAGTSGRLGILDASECPPTYGTDPALIQGIIAGGPEAILHAAEGAEDEEAAGERAIADKKVGKNDVVVGIAASGRTPYVLAAVREAKRAGAVTVGISCSEGSLLSLETDIAITPVVGPEAVTGSTRMKAGTAQKLVLNMLSTAAMIRLGKVYGNLMVDMHPSNEKLRDRAERIVMAATESDRDTARNALGKASGNTKTAIAMLLTGKSREEAEILLADAGGQLSRLEAKEL